MGLFSRKTEPSPPPASAREAEPRHSGGLFSRQRSTSRDSAERSAARSSTSSGNRNTLFRRNMEDPSVVAARERVLSAEQAERDADRALAQAKLAVRNARQEVKNLEREAAEQAQAAKIKQRAYQDLSKRAKPLGRHSAV